LPISPSPATNTAVYLGKVQVNAKTCVHACLCEEVWRMDGIYINASGQKEAFSPRSARDQREQRRLIFF